MNIVHFNQGRRIEDTLTPHQNLTITFSYILFTLFNMNLSGWLLSRRTRLMKDPIMFVRVGRVDLSAVKYLNVPGFPAQWPDIRTPAMDSVDFYIVMVQTVHPLYQQDISSQLLYEEFDRSSQPGLFKSLKSIYSTMGLLGLKDVSLLALGVKGGAGYLGWSSCPYGFLLGSPVFTALLDTMSVWFLPGLILTFMLLLSAQNSPKFAFFFLKYLY